MLYKPKRGSIVNPLLYRHPKMTDVALQVLKYTEEEDTHVLKVVWWNIGACHEPWCMNIVETLRVKESFVIELVPYKRETP